MLLFVALSGPFRAALIAVEPAVAPCLFLVALVLAALRAKASAHDPAAKRAPRFERRVSRVLRGSAPVLAVLLFLLPIWSHWAQRPPSRISAFSSLLGYLPWGDAIGHYEGGTRLLAEGRFGGFSERRPLGAAWLGIRLALTQQRLPAAQLLQAALVGLAAWLAARAIARRFGLAPALASFALILGLTREYLPGVLTEPLGIALGCLALVALVSESARRSLAVAAFGVLVLATALQARPGAQFALPLMMLWVVVAHRASLARAAVAVVLAALLTLAHTRALNGLYGTGEASATSYPALTLYGLTRNANYQRAYQELDGEIARLGGERAAAPEIYRRALQRLREDPSDFLTALAHNEREFANKLQLNLARVISPRWIFAPYETAGAESAILWDRWLGGVLVVVAGAGFAWGLWHRRRTLEPAFWLAALAGVALSAAFVFGDAGFRGLAAAYPFLAAALGLGLASGVHTLNDTAVAEERRDVRAAIVATAALLVATLVGPWLAHAASERPQESALRGLVPEQSAVIDRSVAPQVLVTNRGDTHPGVPTLDGAEYQRLLELGNFHDAADLASLRLPVALVSAFDYVAHRQRLLIAPPRMLREDARFLRLRLEPIPGSDYVARVEAWSALDAPESRP